MSDSFKKKDGRSNNGKHGNGGRPSTWLGIPYSETTVVRVPKYIKKRVLEAAHKLHDKIINPSQ